MNDFIIEYNVYLHSRSKKPLEVRKIDIKAYCKAEAIEKFPYYKQLIQKITKK